MNSFSIVLLLYQQFEGRNAYFLKLFKYRSLREEFDPQTSKIDQLLDGENSDDNDLIFYVLMRAADDFFIEFNRYPGESIQSNDTPTVQSNETDLNLFKKVLTKFMDENRLNFVIKDDYIQEMYVFLY
jgi:NEDD8-activating enzyme E1 regulatory subunit